MKARGFDPLRLDVAAFAKEAGRLEGDWPLAALARLAESAAPEAPPRDTDRVRWQAQGESRTVRGGPAQVWLHVEAGTEVALQCQRCLQPMPVALAAQRSFLFVPGEGTAAELDAESEDDVLALTRSLNLQELVEDELLLVLPLVPRHDRCPSPLVVAEEAEAPVDAPLHPFAALAGLKGRTRPN
jgi:uncharacterized protein